MIVQFREVNDITIGKDHILIGGTHPDSDSMPLGVMTHNLLTHGSLFLLVGVG